MKSLGISIALAGVLAGSGPQEKRAESEAERQGRALVAMNRREITDRQFRSHVELSLIDRDGRTQTREFRRYSETDARDLEKFLVIFMSPATIRNTGLLNIEQQGRDDDLWLYLPALKKTKRISGTNLRASWVGTEFSYKDLRRENLEGNRYVLAGMAEGAASAIEGASGRKPDLFLVDAFPVTDQEKDEQGYSRRRIWLRSDNFLAERVEFYEEAGELLKTSVLTDFRKVGRGGKVRAHRVTMTNRKGVKTVIAFKEIHINEGDLEDEMFTVRFIEEERQ